MKHALFISGFASLFVFTTAAMAQTFSGVATYHSSNQMNIQLDSTNLSPDQIQQMRQQLKKQMERDYTLSFNTYESSWKMVASLNNGPAVASSGGVQVNVSDADEDDVLYKNIATGQFEQGRDLMGKRFLIKDSLKSFSWKITDETKSIGHYLCRKAVYQNVMESRSFSSDGSMITTQDTVQIIAWYTPEIPVGHGPARFYGLPGLILAISSGGQSMQCSQVILNPTEPVMVVHPQKGKVVDEAAFQLISDQKMEEMMQRYEGSDEHQVKVFIKG